MVNIDNVVMKWVPRAILLFVIFLVIYLFWAVPEIDKCHDKGGKIVRIEGADKCISANALGQL